MWGGVMFEPSFNLIEMVSLGMAEDTGVPE